MKSFKRSLVLSYAKALTENAVEVKAVSAIHGSMSAARDLFKSYPMLLAILANPSLARNQRDALILGLAEKLELHPSVTNLLRLLVRNHHMKYFMPLTVLCETLLERAQGIMQVTVISAHPLSSSHIQALSTWLKERTSFKPRICSMLDSSLIGGLVIEYDNRRLDASLRTQLCRLSRALKGSL